MMEPAWNSYQQDADNTEQLIQEISSNIQKISQNVNTIERMVNQLGTNQDNEQLRSKLHDMEHDTKTLSQDTARILNHLKNLTTSNNLDEQRKSKLLLGRLMKDFSTALNNFKAVQHRTAQKEKIEVVRAKYDVVSEDQGGVALTGPLQQKTQMQQEIDVQTLRERQEAMVQLESDISDVNQIFKDLALMVHDQGEMLDSIEANVDNAQIHVQHGASQIAKAADYQSRARRKKFICLIVLAACVAVLSLIIYLAVR